MQLQDALPQDLVAALAPILGWDTPPTPPTTTAPPPPSQNTQPADSQQTSANEPSGNTTTAHDTDTSAAAVQPSHTNTTSTTQGNMAQGNTKAHQAPAQTLTDSSGQVVPGSTLLPSDWWQAVASLSDEHLAGILKAVFGHSAFRGNQLPLIRSALQGKHVAGVLPTGAGKSLCYQLPAILLPGEA